MCKDVLKKKNKWYTLSIDSRYKIYICKKKKKIGGILVAPS